MTTIVVIGGTGFAGSAIVEEATRRGHHVVSLSRTLPPHAVDGVEYRRGDAAAAGPLIADADVVIGALSPRGATAGTLPDTYAVIASQAADRGARLIVVGGFGSLRPAVDAPRFAETDAMPPQVLPEAREMLEVLKVLQNTPATLDWVFVSPAQQFGAYRPAGPARDGYRLGNDVALLNDDGTSTLEASDFALAILDEVDRPAHHRDHISVAN